MPTFFARSWMGVIHYGVVAALPWLLWLSLLILDSGGGRKSAAVPAKPAVALAVLLAALAASDLLVVPQFAAPMALCAVVLAAKGALSPRKCLIFIALLAAGTIVGKVLAEAPGIICGMSAACEGVGSELGGVSARAGAAFGAFRQRRRVRSPLAAAMWLAFAAIAAWRAASVLWPSLRRSVAGGAGRSGRRVAFLDRPFCPGGDGRRLCRPRRHRRCFRFIFLYASRRGAL